MNTAAKLFTEETHWELRGAELHSFAQWVWDMEVTDPVQWS